ncbi:hypothetical protein LWI29_012564 [Acer saccharum]|uniref:Chromo domain-containing protein n=1 Tax=Acer saccharum TaxID=4024 RepID=A0AA39T328_ACESA|nr:hypothetical protein LWI29_012564 [Acer saccharum]
MKLKGGGGKKKTGLPQNDVVDFEMTENSFDAGNTVSVDVNRDNHQVEDGGGREEELAVMVVENEEELEEEEEAEEDEEEGVQEETDTQEDRPKLDDGFYEIEAVRRRRVRKGQLQYLIKWRGWPETANTWEPLENLQSCSDVIDAFEESLRSGKPSRKRKRKSGGSLSLSKKKQPRSTSTAYNVTVGIGQSPSSAPLMSTSFLDFSTPTQLAVSVHESESNGDVNNIKTANQTNENRIANGSKQIDGRVEESEYDPKLSELKGTISTNEVHADKLAIHLQEDNVSEGNGPAHPKVDCVELVQSDRRIGARRRKSGSVKRFKQDLAASKLVAEPESTPSFSFGCTNTVEQLGIGDSTYMNKIDGSRNASAIVKILKAISFSASVSDNVQDVVVTFVAVRSDGKEVMVDNKFLKANDPLLLINFYEQNLKYNANAP